MDSFILLSRCILDSQVFASEKMLKVWIWCLCKASFKERYLSIKVGKGTTDIKLNRGEFLFGRNKAEEDLNIDNSTIYKIIKKLEKLEMISVKSNNHYSIITICNYDTYQDPKNYQVTANEQPTNSKRSAKGTQKNTNNTSNTGNKDNKEENINKAETILSSIDRELLTLLPEQQRIWQKFTEWFKGEEFKNVVKIKEQLSPKQLINLLENYGATEIKDTLLALENYNKISNYNSVYLTLNNWLKRPVLKTA